MANPYFNAVYYLQNNPDLMAAGVTAATAWDHYVQYGANEAYAAGGSVRAPNDWFDARAYLNGNPDLIAAGVTPANALDHFQAYGANELRSPNAQIAASPITAASLVAYVNANADIATALSITIPATTLTAAQQNAVVAQFYGYGINESRPSAPTNFEPQPNPGQTFTLTTAIDNIQGTAGNDTVLGSDTTLQAADNINGGAGTDTLNLALAATTTHYLRSSNVEILNTQALGGARTVDLTNTSGAEQLWSDNSTDAVTYDNVQALAAGGVRGGDGGADNFTVQFKNTLLTGASDKGNLVLDGANTTGTVNLVGTGADGFETIDIVGQNANSSIGTLGTSNGKLKTVNVSADANVTITNALTGVTKVDASASKANVSVQLATGDVTVKGGAGNDTFNFGTTLTVNDVIDGGAGTDTLRFNGTSFTKNLQVSNIEQVQFDGAGTFNFNDLTGGASVTKAIVANSGTTTLNNLAKAASVQVRGSADGATVTVGVKDADAAGSNNDEITVSLGHTTNGTGDGALLNSLTINNVETINIENSNAASSTGTLTAGAVTTLNLKNTESTSVQGTVGTLTKLDGSTATGAINAGGLTVSTSAVALLGGSKADQFTGNAGNDSLVGGAGNDTLQGRAGNDVIEGGDGDDVIDGGAGVDKLTGGAGRDTFITVDANTVGAASTATTTITDLVAGTDKIGFGTAITSVVTLTTNYDSQADLITAAAAAGTGATGTAVTAGIAAVFDYKSEKYVLIDANNTAGYTDGTDILLKVTGLTGTLATTDFTTAGTTITSNGAIVGTALDDTLTGGAGNDTITGAAGADTMTGGTGADTFAYGSLATVSAQTGITLATADTITGFVSGTDFIKTGTAGTVANYSGAAAVASFALAQAAADTAMDGTVVYHLTSTAADGGLLFVDSNADGTADAVIKLTGVDFTSFAFGDIIA